LAKKIFTGQTSPVGRSGRGRGLLVMERMIPMKSKLHHVALNVHDLEWYAAFFQDVFHMEVRKTAGDAPSRKIWLMEGIQLNECQDESDIGNVCDHISIAVPDVAGTVDAALSAGCTTLPNGEHWFSLPNGVMVELMRAELPME